MVENKIVYLGESYREPGTFVLETNEESEQLRIIRKDSGFYLSRGLYDTASRVVRNEIYAFKNGNYDQVYRYSLESGKWTLYYPKA